MNRIARRWREARANTEAGMSLLEVTVTMSIMAVFMVIFTAGMSAIFGSVGKDEALNDAQSRLNLTFQRLDKEVRYASVISQPDRVGGDWYVELLTTNTGTPRCTQLRLTAGGRLERRSWTKGSAISSGEPWTLLVAGLTSTQPFTVSTADPTFNFQRLRLWVQATSGLTGGGSGPTSAGSTNETDVTFTALNTSLRTTVEERDADAIVCTEGRTQP
jgi:prepilin-type N-terminal cleavage/methylation domain-containing protein